MSNLFAWLRNAEEIAAGVLLACVIGITAYNIVNRYLLGLPAAWAPELAGFLFTWVVFLGASAAAKRDMHVSISVVTDRLGPALRAMIALATDAILLLFFAYAAYLAVKITISSYSRVSPVMRLPYSYVYASAALCFVLIGLRKLATVTRRLSGAGGPGSA